MTSAEDQLEMNLVGNAIDAMQGGDIPSVTDLYPTNDGTPDIHRVY